MINADTTLKRLVAQMEIWATAHKQINKFGYGDFLELYSESSNLYPYFMVNTSNAGSDQWYYKFSIDIMCLDWVWDDHENDLYAESDTLEIIRDFENTVRWSPRWQEFSRVNGDLSLRKFVEKGGDKVYGWGATLNLSIKKRSGFCDITNLLPTYDFEGQTTGTSCEAATVLVNGEELNAIPSGGSLDIVVKDTDDNIVGTLSGGNTVTVPASSGGSIDISLNGTLAYDDQSVDVDIPIHDTGGLDVGTWTGTEQQIADSTVNVKDSAGSTLYAVGVVAEGTANQTVNDCIAGVNGTDLIAILAEQTGYITVKNSNLDPIGAEDGEDWIIADCVVDIYLDGGLQSSTSVPAETSDTINVIWT